MDSERVPSLFGSCLFLPSLHFADHNSLRISIFDSVLIGTVKMNASIFGTPIIGILLYRFYSMLLFFAFSISKVFPFDLSSCCFPSDGQPGFRIQCGFFSIVMHLAYFALSLQVFTCTLVSPLVSIRYHNLFRFSIWDII